MNIIDIRKKYQGLWGINTKVPVIDSHSLSLVYTPGVGKCCKEIEADLEKAFELTNKANSIAIITDCSTYKDFETINPLCAIPELESKALYYKEIAGIDAYPIIVSTHEIEKTAEIINNLTPNFASFDLEGFLPERTSIIESMVKKTELPILYSFRTPNLFNALKETGIINKISPEIIIPALMRGAIDMRATEITDEMLDSVVTAFKEADESGLITEDCCNQYNFKLAAKIAYHVAKAAYDNGVSKVLLDPEKVEEKYLSYIYEGKKSLFKASLPDFKTETNNINENSVELHRKAAGVIETGSKINIKNPYDYKDFYGTEPNEQVTKEIELDYKNAYDLTTKGNLVGVISDGSAVLGYGNIGSDAALPVMEGKAALFKSLAGVDAIPICLKTQNVDELVDYISHITPILGGINLEDICAPRCFELEKALIEKLNIPVFHDDQHGTAVIVLAGFLNALKLTGKKISKVKIAMSGAGAAAQAVSKLLLQNGVKNLTLCDINGSVYKGRKENDRFLDAMAEKTNPENIKGTLADVMKGADFLIGLSAAGIVSKEMVKSMNEKAVVFALANPIPEIMPELAKEAGAFIVATGRSDLKNQINNSLAFPGIFRGTLDARAKVINNKMKLAAAHAIADLIPEEELTTDNIIPNALDLRVPPAVARAVTKAAVETGVAQLEVDPDSVYEHTKNYLYTGILKG